MLQREVLANFVLFFQCRAREAVAMRHLHDTQVTRLIMWKFLRSSPWHSSAEGLWNFSKKPSARLQTIQRNEKADTREKLCCIHSKKMSQVDVMTDRSIIANTHGGKYRYRSRALSRRMLLRHFHTGYCFHSATGCKWWYKVAFLLAG
jgi:hypothetical protein